MATTMYYNIAAIIMAAIAAADYKMLGVAPQGTQLLIECDSGNISSIISAKYGSPACQMKDVKEIVHRLCITRPSCSMRVDDELLGGDACLGQQKNLSVEAVCSEKPRTFVDPKARADPGSLSFGMLLKLASLDDVDLPERELRQTFDASDQDKDGKINETEVNGLTNRLQREHHETKAMTAHIEIPDLIASPKSSNSSSSDDRINKLIDTLSTLSDDIKTLLKSNSTAPPSTNSAASQPSRPVINSAASPPSPRSTNLAAPPPSTKSETSPPSTDSEATPPSTGGTTVVPAVTNGSGNDAEFKNMMAKVPVTTPPPPPPTQPPHTTWAPLFAKKNHHPVNNSVVQTTIDVMMVDNGLGNDTDPFSTRTVVYIPTGQSRKLLCSGMITDVWFSTYWWPNSPSTEYVRSDPECRHEENVALDTLKQLCLQKPDCVVTTPATTLSPKCPLALKYVTVAYKCTISPLKP